MHDLLDHDGHIPAFTTVTDARTHEGRIASSLELPKGFPVVFDMGSIRYTWFRDLGERGRFFVTHLKRNSVYKLPIRCPVNRKTGIKSDHIIEIASQGKRLRLRRIGYRGLGSGRRYEFLTNHFQLSPETIAEIYKERWKIDLFFKEIKQNLRIKSFVGNSENAVLIHLYTALTVYLLLVYQKFFSRTACPFNNFSILSRSIYSMTPWINC